MTPDQLEKLKWEVIKFLDARPYTSVLHGDEQCHVFDAIDHLAATGRLTQGWQPIETAPKVEDEKSYLLYNGSIKIATFWDCYNSFVEIGEFLKIDNPTHWMPLPQPPERKG